MEDELLQIIEAMEAAGESPEEIAKVVQAYNVPAQEKKNPNVTDSTSEDGSSEPPKVGFKDYLAYAGSAMRGLPYVGPKSESMKALESGTARMVGGLMGLPDKLAKADLTIKMELAKTFGSDEVKKKTQEIQDKINSLPEDQRTEAKLKLQAATTPASQIFGIDVSPVNQWFADQADDIKDAQEEIDKTRKAYDTNIIDDIKSGNIGQASGRMVNGLIESVPMMMMTVGTGGAGLLAVGGSVASDKMEELEREGEMSDLEMLGVGAARGTFEAAGGKLLQGIFKPVLGKVSSQQAAEITESFVSRLKNAATNAGKEFSEEAAQSLQEEITDALIKGEDIEWGKTFKNAVDGGLIGAFSTAPANIIPGQDAGQAQRALDVEAGNVIPLGIRAVEQDGTELRQIGEQSRAQMQKKDVPTKQKINKQVDNALDQLVDRQASVKRKIRKAGLPNTNAFMVANSGASAQAKNLSEKAYNGTVANLTNAEISTLEEIIFARRVQAIDANRLERGLEPVLHPNGYNSQKAEKDLQAYREQLGEDAYNNLLQRSENYFNEYKSLLQTMYTEGLITQQTYDTFAEVNYQPRQFLDLLEDMDGNFLLEELGKSEAGSLAKNQIKSLKEGSDGMLNMDAFGILQASIMSRSRAVFANRMNSTFSDEFRARKKEIDAMRQSGVMTKEQQQESDNFAMLEADVKPDKIVKFDKKGNPQFAMKGVKGFSPIYYYKDGVRNRMWLRDEFYNKYTDTNNQYIGATARENIALFSGTSSVKTLATGNNPLFFITNTPRDFLFVLGFSPEYGNEVISNSLKLTVDAARGIRDVVRGGANYDKYLEYGGGMDFLALQGKYKEKGLLKKGVDAAISQKTQDKITKNWAKRNLDKFNLASEVGIRMAVFNKSIQNQMKELGIEDINSLDKSQQDIIYTKAVKSARELTDFNQGGKVTKALDAGLPYLNAAVQGTRAAASNLKQRPLETTARIAQITGYTAALSIGGAMAAIARFRDDEDEEVKGMSNNEIYFETLRGVSPYDLNNYFIVPLGSRDADGNWNYLRVAKSQAITPALNAAEHFIRKQMASVDGIQYQQDLGETMMETFNTNILPMEPNVKKVASRVPLFDASMALYGIDSYTGNPLSWDRGKIPEQLEGIVDSRVEPVYKELGKAIDQSPVRLQSAVESYITTPSTNPYVGMIYGMGNLVTSDDSFDEVLGDFAGDMGKAMTRRLFKSTSEYNKVAKAKERASEEIIEAYRKHIESEATVRNAVKEAKRTGDSQAALEGIQEVYAENPELLEKSLKWFKSEVGKKRLNPLVSSLRFEDNKEVKALLIADRFGDKLLKNQPDYSEQEKAILKQLLEEKVIDQEVLVLYKNIFN